MLTGKQVSDLISKIAELTAVAYSWKAKAEQQELEIAYLRECLEKERSKAK